MRVVTDPTNHAERTIRSGRTGLRGRLTDQRLLRLGIDFPRSVRFGEHLRLRHNAFGLVVHESTQIGDRVQLYQGVTIGRSDQRNPAPAPGGGVVIEDDVIVSAGACILFRSGEVVTLGRGCTIGAGAVVTKSVPSGETWVGVPADRLPA